MIQIGRMLIADQGKSTYFDAFSDSRGALLPARKGFADAERHVGPRQNALVRLHDHSFYFPIRAQTI